MNLFVSLNKTRHCCPKTMRVHYISSLVYAAPSGAGRKGLRIFFKEGRAPALYSSKAKGKKGKFLIRIIESNCKIITFLTISF